MPLVSANKISMHYGGPLLLADLSLKVESGARVGLVGRNGTGKSTLLKLLGGRLAPSTGDVVRPGGARVAYQAQELEFEPGTTVFEEMRVLFDREARTEQELRTLENRLAVETDAEERDRLLRTYERRQREQEEHGVYDIDRRIASVLTSLGLPESAWEQPVEAFSGGERNIIGLARVVLAEPDLMLLDEPSNHLDMEGVEWFIDFLRRTRAAFVMVSHNRHLLDATVREMWELRRQQVTSWAGNYSDYQRQKAEARARQERQYKVQQRLITRIQFQARRLMDMANAYDDPGQAKRAKAMLKRIERMDLVERPDAEKRSFGGALRGHRHGRIALTIQDFSFAYDERVLFDRANLEVEFGERVCLVGPNGSGKTTLFREILEKGGWENPTLRLGKSVKVGEYRQLHDVLDERASLLDWCMHTLNLIRRPAADLLHRFQFAYEDLDRPIGTLSGGEKSRLQLARLVHEEVNFLLLDEPTNHLDIPSCEVLEEMLGEFEGTLLVISHDRYFLDKLVQRVVEVADRGLLDRRCSFAEWWETWQHDRGRLRKSALVGREGERAGKAEARSRWDAAREERRVQSRREGRVRTLEREIERLEARRVELETAIEAAYAARETTDEGARLSAKLERTREALAAQYAAWEEALAELETD